MSCDYSHDKHMLEPQLRLNNLWGNTVRKRGVSEILDQHWISGYVALQQYPEALTACPSFCKATVKEKKEQFKSMNNPDHFHVKVRDRSLYLLL